MHRSASATTGPRLVARARYFILERYEVLRQKPGQVAVRAIGDRFLSLSEHARTEAEKHWECAWLSVAAYGRTKPMRNRQAACECPISSVADTELHAAAWTRWKGFPDDELLSAIDSSHLRVEVWEKVKGDSVRIAVAFGGTVFTSLPDWRSNLRWLLPKPDDEYTEIVNRLAPAFADELCRRIKDGRIPDAANVRVISTGHSLGGGLAQQFAYSLQEPPNLPRVTEVYAFDPSPVTGYYSVPAAQREHNSLGLAIDRIYERGEILALLRSLTSVFVRPSAENPSVRGARYMLFASVNPIAEHSMVKLAKGLQALANPAVPIDKQ